MEQGFDGFSWFFEVAANHGVPVVLLAALLWWMHRTLTPLLRTVAQRHLEFLDATRSAMDRADGTQAQILIAIKAQGEAIQKLAASVDRLQNEVRSSNGNCP